MKDLAPLNQNLIIGGISVYFQPSKTGGFIDLGHIDSNGLARTIERGIYKSNRSGVEEEIYSWLKSRGMTFEVESSATTKKILQLALLADAPANQSQTAATVTAEAVTAKLDRWVRLANRGISSTTITHTSGSPTYVLGTDYELDNDLGMIRCLSTGAITADQSIKANYTAKVMTSLTTMNLLQTSRFTGDLILKMTAENSAVYEYYFPSSELQPKGDLAINTEGPMKTGAFSIKILKDTTATAGTEWGTFREITAAV